MAEILTEQEREALLAPDTAQAETENTTNHTTEEKNDIDTSKPPSDKTPQPASAAQAHTPAKTNTSSAESSQTTAQAATTAQDTSDTPPPKLPEFKNSPQLPDTSKLDKFREQLETAIQNNAGVIANTHYTLLGIAQLLEISRDLWSFYSFHAKNLQLTSEQFESLKASLAQITTYINQALESIASHQSAAQRLFNTTESLLDEAKAAASAISSDLREVKATLAKINALELSLSKITELSNELAAKLAQAEGMKEQLNALVPNILNEVKANLLADKEQYEKELEAKKNEYATLLDEKLSELDEKLAEFAKDFASKKLTMDAAVKKLEDFIATLAAQKIELRQSVDSYLEELKTARDTHTQELEKAKTQKQNELESFKGRKLTELENAAQDELNSIREAASTQITRVDNASHNAQNEIKTFSEEFLREVNAFNSAAILELRDLYYAIATNTQQLGNGYQTRSYTSSGDFHLISGVRDYFVFVRGGTGGSHNGAAGGISSFGGYASANGGAGNTGGAGQRGESRAQFVHIADAATTSVRVNVAHGGVVIISWARDVEARVDTSFFTTEDLKALTRSNDTQDHIRFKQSITNKKDENYYRQLCGLRVNLSPITQEFLPRISHRASHEVEPVKFSTMRQLELYAAEQFLREGVLLNDFVASLINSTPDLTLSVTPESLQLKVGESATLVDSATSERPAVSVSSSHITLGQDPETDTETWQVTGVSAGTATITFTIYDPLKQKDIITSVEVVVSEPKQTQPEPESTTPPASAAESSAAATTASVATTASANTASAAESSQAQNTDFSDEDLGVLFLTQEDYNTLKLKAQEKNKVADFKADLRECIEQERSNSSMPKFREMDNAKLLNGYSKLADLWWGLENPSRKGEFVREGILGDYFDDEPERMSETLGYLETHVAQQILWGGGRLPTMFEQIAKTIAQQDTGSKAQWEAVRGRGLNALMQNLLQHFNYAQIGIPAGAQPPQEARQQLAQVYINLLTQAGVGDDASANDFIEEMILIKS